MNLGLERKVALITLASEGLGFACAARSAEAGCKVAIGGRRSDAFADAQEALSKNGAGGVLAPVRRSEVSSLEVA